MHELSIIDGILRAVGVQQKQRGFDKVKSVELVCRRYNCLSEDNLQFCFRAATEGTCLAGASLKITRRAEGYRCDTCGAEFDAAGQSEARCPSCRSPDVTPLIDHAVYIRSLEVE